MTLRSRRWSGGVVAGLTAGAVLVGTAVPGPAEAVVPAGSRAQVILETNDATLDPDNALTSGWWGHEGAAGPTGAGATFLSINGADPSGTVSPTSTAALLTAMGADSFDNIWYAVVPTSADGTSEAPLVDVGENAAEVFQWVLPSNVATALSGSSAANDSVATISTLSQLTAWVNAGQPVQNYDNNLTLHDVNTPGSPVSPTPKGTSMLNTWPAGTELSLVAYVTDGLDSALNNVVPIVKRGADGKAQTAWMPFTTVVSPSSALRTSAGYQVTGPYKPTITTTSAFSGSNGSLTATVTTKANTTATNASGTVEFSEVVGGVRGAPTPVATSNGVASLPITGLAPGGSRIYDLRYVPDTAGQANYLTSDFKRVTVQNPAVVVNPPPPPPPPPPAVVKTATTTSLSVVGGKKAKLTAALGPAGVAGSVVFKDGATTLATVSKAATATSVTALAPLGVGQHALSATFTPADATKYTASTASTTAFQASIKATLKPGQVVHGTKPKLTVKIATAGAAITGKAKIVVKYGAKKATQSLKLVKGIAVFTLPKAVAGKASVTVSYPGSGPVLATSKVLKFTVT